MSVFRESKWNLLAVATCVLVLKAYVLVLLFVFSRQTPVRGDYDAFLCLDSGQTREARLKEIQGCFLERLAPYDGQFYLDIAQRGYRVFEKDDPNFVHGPGGNYAFFPLYPLLARCAWWLGKPLSIAVPIVLNTLLATAAAVGVYRLSERIGVPPWPSVLFLATFPTAIFQSVLYTESLFLCLAVGTACCGAAGAARSAVVLGYLSGLCRPQGVLVGALCATQTMRRKSWLPAVASLAGTASFATLLWAQIGAPLGFLGIQSQWARQFSLRNLLGECLAPWAYKGPPFDLLALAFGVGLLPFLWRRLPPPLALFGTLSVALPLATGTMLSFGRFVSVSFPHFMCLASLLDGWRIANATLLAVFIIIQCLLAKGLVGWYFVG